MPEILPTVRSGAQCLYPVTRTNRFATRVVQFQNGTEQRWKQRAPLHEWQLQYTGIKAADVVLLQTFWDAIKGQFDSTWEFTFGATTYQYLAALEDSLVIRENRKLLYDVGFRFRQTRKSGAVTGSGGGSFPTLSTGVLTQRPYGRSRRFFSTVNDQESGKRYAWPWYSGALTGFPTKLMAWTVGGPALADVDADTLEAYFALQNGRYGTFSLTDPDTGSVYSKVRFATDGFERRYLGPNENAITLPLEEFN